MEKIFRAVMDASQDAIFIHKRLKFIYMNQRGAEILKVEKPEDAIGKDVRDFIQLGSDSIHPDELHKAINGELFTPYYSESYYHVNGHEIKMAVYVENLTVDGENYAKVVCKNVPEKKKILELEEQNRLREEFFANLSHELRTPLNIILSGMQLMEKRENIIHPAEDACFKSVRRSGYRLLRLVNNILDMTKIDSGNFDVSMSKVNIVYIVEDIIESAADYIKSKGIEIQFDTDVEEKTVLCNVECIDRIILNILSNAVKFTPKGGRIDVSIYDRDDSVHIHIKDTGIGIDDKNLRRIFERFEQVDKSFRRSHEGSGMGLAIVKSLLDIHGGKIKVISSSGEGSDFIIELKASNEKSSFETNEIIDKEKYIDRKVNIEFSDVDI